MGGTIVYYHGCFVNYFDHETGTAVVKVLEKNGFQIEVPELICCSYPLINSGDFSIARKRAIKLIEMLSAFAERGFDIVYSCPTCGYTLKEVIPDLLKSEASRLVAEKTHFISTYLFALHSAGNLNVEFENKPFRIAYHTPCHLKTQVSSSASVQLLSLIPGIDLHYLNRGCCGMGGTWALRSKLHNNLSREIGKSVFEEIRKVRPQLVSTDCAGCQIQIARYSDLSGDKIVHPIQILAEAYSNRNANK
jgi:glycerol-3-phosphate dehydrogenase subunit C